MLRSLSRGGGSVACARGSVFTCTTVHGGRLVPLTSKRSPGACGSERLTKELGGLYVAIHVPLQLRRPARRHGDEECRERGAVAVCEADNALRIEGNDSRRFAVHRGSARPSGDSTGRATCSMARSSILAGKGKRTPEVRVRR